MPPSVRKEKKGFRQQVRVALKPALAGRRFQVETKRPARYLDDPGLHTPWILVTIHGEPSEVAGFPTRYLEFEIRYTFRDRWSGWGQNGHES